jgi:signal recognition particle receptor subunit beta
LACNKSEKITAHPVEFVRKRLEKEIELLRASAGSLEDTSGGAGGATIGGAVQVEPS